MIRPGLGPEEHMCQALKLPSSFGEVGPADLDVLFAAWTTAKLGPSIHVWRHRQLRAITMLSRVVEPLQRALVRGMPVDVRERAQKWNIALIVAMVPLLRWPDRRLAVFRTVGCVEPSSVFWRSLSSPSTVPPTVLWAMQEQMAEKVADPMLQVVQRIQAQRTAETPVVDVPVLMHLEVQQSFPYENVKAPQIQFIVRLRERPDGFSQCKLCRNR